MSNRGHPRKCPSLYIISAGDRSRTIIYVDRWRIYIYLAAINGRPRKTPSAPLFTNPYMSLNYGGKKTNVVCLISLQLRQ